ncbi:uncharacterized protein N7483_010243 [Penicillium malachiteum]|uniref:uncharacterized protein n=1 Tax=Penicillium malachiteum TaxID=1324776 RepID=UPI00254819E3|nr:uncharacterized protein N7483_010243 [Penicillium malachiteum]KAJ5713062.1 hypothetical protein N7483_010243 [Penicillium malachiteum]
MSTEYEDEDYFLPLEDQRMFGAGIRRKRVPFVRSGELNTTSTTKPGTSIADAYLSIVLKRNKLSTSPSTPTNLTSNETPVPPPRTTHSAPPGETLSPLLSHAPTPRAETRLEYQNENQDKAQDPASAEFCEVCNLPLSTDPISDLDETTKDQASETKPRPHEASLAHQLCLKHSHPPSHLRPYPYRLGLGASGREGIREPLKGRIKNDTAGLGAGLDKDGDPIRIPKVEPKKVVKLNAKEVRRRELEAKRKGEKMRNLFFQSDEVLKYLGEGI